MLAIGAVMGADIPAMADPIYVIRPQTAIAKPGMVLPNDAFEASAPTNPATPEDPVETIPDADGYTWRSTGFPYPDQNIIKINAGTLQQFHYQIGYGGKVASLPAGQGYENYCLNEFKDGEADYGQWTGDEYFSVFYAQPYEEKSLAINFHKPGKYGFGVSCVFENGTKHWSAQFSFTVVEGFPEK